MTRCGIEYKILNRLGHGMSYTKVEENETTLCLLKISGATDEVMLPENMEKVQLHRVNGIIVQPKMFGPEPNKPLCPAIQKDKKRS